MEPSQVLTVYEAAARLRVGEETIRNWLRSGRLAGTRPGGKRAGWRIPETEVERLLRPAGVEPSSG